MSDRRNLYPIPTFTQLDMMLGDIEHRCGQLRQLWRWAEPDAFRKPKHGTSELVSGGATADVADRVLATDRYRTLLRHASAEVVDASNRIRGAVADINDALLLLDPPPGATVADVRLLPHPADEGDVRRAREAQERRGHRAQRTGWWDEVTG